MRETRGEAVHLDDGYTLTRTLDMPVAKAWRYWTDADLLVRWFGPKGFEILEVSADPRVGGKWYTRMRSPAGKVYTQGRCTRRTVSTSRSPNRRGW